MSPRLHFLAASLVLLAAGPLSAQYRTYTQIGQLLQDAETQYPDICRVHDLGPSVQGRHLWALRISDNVPLEEDEPEFKYVSTMHGDEWVGTEMCARLIEDLTAGYGSDPRLTAIVDEVDLWIVPLMNPDGYDRPSPTRNNANGVNLNRDFPDPYTSPDNTPAGRQPETAAIMNWSFGESFTLGANLHTGALVVNYPFDNNPSGTSSVYTASPDDDVFIWISETYSQHNLPMWNSPSFFHGITNGTDWYAISGGMQDWNYRYMGTNAVTLEISNTDQPPASQLDQYWDDNRESMLSYIETCLSGVRGVISDEDSAAALAATVTVVGRDHDIYTDPDVGDYHRMLMPGIYDLRVESDGYDPRTVYGVAVLGGPATRLDLALGEAVEVLSPNGGEAFELGEPLTVSWTGSADAQFEVQWTANADDTALSLDDFEDGVLDPAFTLDPDHPWFVTTSSSWSGDHAARADSITHMQQSWMSRSVAGGEISFWYRVSSESSYDFFSFYIDGDTELHVSGQGGWTHYATTLPDGMHELRWEYSKDINTSSGSDTVWIDDFEWTADLTAWEEVVPLTDVGATSAGWSPTTASDSAKVRVRARYPGGDLGRWDDSDDIFTIAGDPPTCAVLSDCADLDADGLRDDPCTWWACEQDTCAGTAVVVGDLGGPFGACPPDGVADGHDRFHALNCFADTDTSGPGGYPCEDQPPAAFNVDAGGPFGACPPDGVCDANDVFHVLAAFDGTSSCTCPGAPAPVREPLIVGRSAIRAVPRRSELRGGDRVDVDLFLDGDLEDLRGYQLHLGVSGGRRGTLELVDVAVVPRRDEAFANLGHARAFNVRTAQMLAALETPGIAAPGGAYLATFTYRATADAAGRFAVEVLHDAGDPAQRTFLFPTAAGERIEVGHSAAAVIDVGARTQPARTIGRR